MEKVRFFYDFVSPYTYLAAQQVDEVVTRAGGEVEWIPALLGAVMKATGNTPPATLPARAAYMSQDLPRWAALYGVTFKWTPYFPLASVHPMRAALAVRELTPDLYKPFVRALFKAAWADERNIGDRDILATIATECGVAPDLARNATDDPRWKDALKTTTAAALAAGAFGMPSFVLGTTELYFGNDRLPLLEHRLRRGTPFDALATVPAFPI